MYLQILVKMPNTNFTNTHPVGVALYYADRQDEANIRFFRRCFAKALKNIFPEIVCWVVNWIHLALDWF